jgi:hypothetical protein
METTMLKKFLAVTLVAAIFFVQADVKAEAQVVVQANAETAPPADPVPAPEQQPEPANLAQVLKPGVATIKAGTILEFGLVLPLSSSTAKAGDDVQFRILRPLKAGDKTLLAVGTLVHGHVTQAKRAGPNCKQGILHWTIDHLSFPDGTTVKTTGEFALTDPKIPILYNSQYPPDNVNRFATTATYVLMAPLTAVAGVIILVFAGPFLLADFIGEHRHPYCTAPGKDVDLPATTRTGATVKKTYTVHF